MHRPLQSLRRWDDFETYCWALFRTRDVDPVYPFLSAIVKHEAFEADWFAFVYVLYYSLRSAVSVCRNIPNARAFSVENFSILRCIRHFGVERRGTQRRYMSQCAALGAYKTFQPEVQSWAHRGNSLQFRALLRHLPLMGDWASFKLCEVTEKALGFNNLRPQNMDIAARPVNDSQGPCGGCRELYGTEVVYPQSIAAEWEALGVSLAKHFGTDLGEVETALCKWSKVCKGQYFVGHDIHEFAALRDLWPERVFEKLTRQCGFHPAFFSDKLDVRAARRQYRDHGRLLFTQRQYDAQPTLKPSTRAAACPTA